MKRLLVLALCLFYLCGPSGAYGQKFRSGDEATIIDGKVPLATNAASFDSLMDAASGADLASVELAIKEHGGFRLDKDSKVIVLVDQGKMVKVKAFDGKRFAGPVGYAPPSNLEPISRSSSSTSWPSASLTPRRSRASGRVARAPSAPRPAAHAYASRPRPTYVVPRYPVYVAPQLVPPPFFGFAPMIPPASPDQTVFVQGYYRSDGTYVRPHMRRPPGN